MGEFKLNFKDFYSNRSPERKDTDSSTDWIKKKDRNGRMIDFFNSMSSKCEIPPNSNINIDSFAVKNNITELVIKSDCELYPDAFKHLPKLKKITMIDYKGNGRRKYPVTPQNKNLEKIHFINRLPFLDSDYLDNVICGYQNIKKCEQKALSHYSNTSYDLSLLGDLCPGLFMGNKNLESVKNIPTVLPKFLFCDCINLSAITIDSPTVFDDNCFKGCRSLHLTINADATSLGKDCFTGIFKLSFNSEKCPMLYEYCKQYGLIEDGVYNDTKASDNRDLDELNKQFDDLEEVVESNWVEDNDKWEALESRVKDLRGLVDSESIDFKTFKQTFLDIQKDFNAMK